MPLSVFSVSQRGTKSLSWTFSWTVPIWWNDLPNSIPAAESLPSSRNTSLPSLFDPRTLALSILVLFNLICLLFIKKTLLTLYQVHIYSLTASFSCKTNTKFHFSIFDILVFIKRKPSYVYCVRLTGLVIALACCCFLLVLIASIMSSFVSRFG